MVIVLPSYLTARNGRRHRRRAAEAEEAAASTAGRRTIVAAIAQNTRHLSRSTSCPMQLSPPSCMTRMSPRPAASCARRQLRTLACILRGFVEDGALHLGGLLEIDRHRVHILRSQRERRRTRTACQRDVGQGHVHRHARLIAVHLVGAEVGLHVAVLVAVLLVVRLNIDAGGDARLVARHLLDRVIRDLGRATAFFIASSDLPSVSTKARSNRARFGATSIMARPMPSTTGLSHQYGRT